MRAAKIPRLHLIGPLGIMTPEEFACVALLAASGGCDAIHLRLPDRPGGEILACAREMIARLPEGTALIVNDRLDVAVLSGAAGLQLGERSVSVEESRGLLDESAIIGRSVHDLEGAQAAEAAGADYLLAGHVFATPSKEGQPGRGLDWLGEIADAVRIPVIALGGITIDRVEVVRNAGAHGVAVGRELLTAADPAATASALRTQLDSA